MNKTKSAEAPKTSKTEFKFDPDIIFTCNSREALKESIESEAVFILNMRKLAEHSMRMNDGYTAGYLETVEKHMTQRIKLIDLLCERNDAEIDERQEKSVGFLAFWHRMQIRGLEEENHKMRDERARIVGDRADLRDEIDYWKPAKPAVSQEPVSAPSRRASGSQASP